MKKMQIAFSIGMMAIMLITALSLSLAPSALAVTDPLGVGYAADTGLGSRDVRVTVANIIKTALQLLGIVAVVIILIGGFTWMTAGGNDEKVGEAKKWIFSGIIGLAIILSAYALASWVINQLGSATDTTGFN